MILTETEQIVMELAHEEGLLLYRALKGKKDFSEFKLAEKIDKDINATRRILYTLHSHSLASFVKKKDQKKGWYIYYWTFDERHAKLLFDRSTHKKANARIENATYSCKNKCGKLEFEEAFDSGYKCPECGEMLIENSGRKNLLSLN